MCLSDEPGYYEDGNFGIRIENVDVVIKHPTLPNMITWYNMTMAPYCQNLMKMDLLTKVEIEHINTYHQEVLKNLMPLMKNELSMNYLKKECAHIHQ